MAQLHQPWHWSSVGRGNECLLPSMLVDKISCAPEEEEDVTFLELYLFCNLMHSVMPKLWRHCSQVLHLLEVPPRTNSPSCSKRPFPLPPFVTVMLHGFTHRFMVFLSYQLASVFGQPLTHMVITTMSTAAFF